MILRAQFFSASTVIIALTVLFSAASAQREAPVKLIFPDGSQAPFTLTWAVNWGTEGIGIAYWDSERFRWGVVTALVGGARTTIPFDQLARADAVGQGATATWRFTLKDGSVLEAYVPDPSYRFTRLELAGVNQFGATEHLLSNPREPGLLTFVSVIFDPDAVAPGEATAQQPAARADVDSVTLRNGDVLSGSILTGEFTVQASYGTLTFSSEQLASIRIEDAAGKTDQVLLKVGDRVSGVLQNTTIEMTLTTGATITLEKGNIASITFATED